MQIDIDTNGTLTVTDEYLRAGEPIRYSPAFDPAAPPVVAAVSQVITAVNQAIAAHPNGRGFTRCDMQHESTIALLIRMAFALGDPLAFSRIGFRAVAAALVGVVLVGIAGV